AMAMQMAVTQLAVSAWLAPTAAAAAMMMASVPPKPTMAATNAETGMERRISRPTVGRAGPGFSRGSMPSPCPLHHGFDGAEQHLQVLRPRQAVVALRDQRQGHVVGRQQAGKLHGMRGRNRSEEHTSELQ